MTNLTITDLDDEMTSQISRRAREHGHSIEDEARALLRQALEGADDQPASEPSAEGEPGESLFDTIRRRFEPLGGVDLEIPPREFGRDPPTFD